MCRGLQRTGDSKPPPPLVSLQAISLFAKPERKKGEFLSKFKLDGQEVSLNYSL